MHDKDKLRMIISGGSVPDSYLQHHKGKCVDYIVSVRSRHLEPTHTGFFLLQAQQSFLSRVC